MLKVILLGLTVSCAWAVECPMMCTMEWDPVCGEDGNTYGNPCSLSSSVCKNSALNGVAVKMAYKGECKIDLENEIAIEPPAEEMGDLYDELMKHEAPRDELRFRPKDVEEVYVSTSCLTMCSKIYDPVCGDDSVEYPNECELGNANCRLKKDVKVAKKGLC